MPIRKPKPTSAGTRFVSYPDFAEITKTEPERSLVEGLTKSGGRNALGRKTSRHRGGGAKRLYRRIDFKRRKDGVPGARRGDRVRPQPHRLHRAAALRRRREALHPRAGAADGRDDRRLRRGRRHHRRQLPAARPDADRHGRAQRRAAAGPRRPARALGGRLDPADGQGRRHGDAAPALGRDAPRARRLPRDRRRDRQRRPPERQGRQGRAQAPPGRAPADPRRRDEPGRPPARRRRGPDHRRAPPGDAVGQADARLPHAQEGQAVRSLRSSAVAVAGRASDEPLEQEGARSSRSA